MKYILLIFLPFLASAQQPEALFGQLVQKFKKVNHYEVVAQIKPNIPMIRILPVKAKIQFQYPNTYKIQSAGISILPKNGFSELPQLFSKPNQFTVIGSGQESLNGVSTTVLTLLPLDNDGDLILAKIWVDAANLLVLKSLITSKTNGSITSTFQYDSEKSWGLPAQMTFFMDVKKFKIPKGLATDINRTTKVTDDKQPKGKIEIVFSKYKINS